MTIPEGGDIKIAPDVIHNLGLVSGPLPAAITLLAPVILFGYTLSRRKHASILAKLNSRRSAT
jgi:Na+/melibiose symporter-like transporter